MLLRVDLQYSLRSPFNFITFRMEQTAGDQQHSRTYFALLLRSPFLLFLFWLCKATNVLGKPLSLSRTVSLPFAEQESYPAHAKRQSNSPYSWPSKKLRKKVNPRSIDHSIGSETRNWNIPEIASMTNRTTSLRD